jgi:UDP-N-acetylmuramoylalanine--D-glutamate ligase
VTQTVVVVGLGVTGRSVVRHLVSDGASVTVVDDRPTDESRAAATEFGVELVEAPDRDALAALVAAANLVVPSPGVPLAHPIYEIAERAGVPVVSEVELASRRIKAPIVAVTGTNGKTTVCTLIAAMLVESGLRAAAAGNIGLPLIDVVENDLDVFVVEVSSFQLQFTDTFRPIVAVWLNLAEDHLDWHPSMAHYAAAKARIWSHQRASDVAIVNADDPAVMDAVKAAPSRVVTFGRDGEFRVNDGVLVTDEGSEILAVAGLRRALPHDVTNALAAAAAALAAGASLDGVRTALAGFESLPHRVQLIGDSYGVQFYDDSKATTPASVLAALQGFESVVLIAGGKNKGLDLSVLTQEAGRIRTVVAIGEAAGEVQSAFDGRRPVVTAGSMDDAVRLARDAAEPGDAVLLSPGCASYDWYHSYAERGDDFVRAVTEQLAEAG